MNMSLLENVLSVLKAPPAKMAAIAAIVVIVGYSFTSKKPSDKVNIGSSNGTHF